MPSEITPMGNPPEKRWTVGEISDMATECGLSPQIVNDVLMPDATERWAVFLNCDTFIPQDELLTRIDQEMSGLLQQGEDLQEQVMKRPLLFRILTGVGGLTFAGSMAVEKLCGDVLFHEAEAALGFAMIAGALAACTGIAGAAISYMAAKDAQREYQETFPGLYGGLSKLHQKVSQSPHG